MLAEVRRCPTSSSSLNPSCTLNGSASTTFACSASWPSPWSPSTAATCAPTGTPSWSPWGWGGGGESGRGWCPSRWRSRSCRKDLPHPRRRRHRHITTCPGCRKHCDTTNGFQSAGKATYNLQVSERFICKYIVTIMQQRLLAFCNVSALIQSESFRTGNFRPGNNYKQVFKRSGEYSIYYWYLLLNNGKWLHRPASKKRIQLSIYYRLPAVALPTDPKFTIFITGISQGDISRVPV